MNVLSKMRIEYEDEHVLVVYKPAGILSQRDATRDASIVDLVRDHLGGLEPFLLHRIDRPVSGLMALAKTKRAAELFSRLLRNGRIRKKYTAIVFGVPSPKGELKHFILEREGKPSVAYKDIPQGTDPKKCKEALLRYELLRTARFHDIKEFDSSFSMLSIELITGRKHQIRSQFSAEGHPIVGDSKYFDQSDLVMKKMLKNSFLPKGEIALVANYLSFPHPLKNGNIVEVKIPIPEHWIKFVGA